MRLIDADALKEDFKERLSNAHKWLEKAKDEEIKIRANAVITYICEVIMTIDYAPTVEPSLNLENITEEEIEKFKILWQRANSKGLLAIKEERPQGEWIPTSERLPSDNEPYEVLCCDIHGEIMIGHPFEDECSECGYSAESEFYEIYECIAWQPLPEPYKEGGKDGVEDVDQ